MKIAGIIPARYASTRFPGKPLIDIGGKSMIQRVYGQSMQSALLSDVIVATDDERIAEHVRSFGGNVCMTSAEHPSGTDRCREVVTNMSLDAGAVINIQGDEPFINPRQIDMLCECFSDERTQIATLVKEITDEQVLFSPNSPKVILDKDGFALYFSREAIPHIRGKEKKDWLSAHNFYQHIGIYGYRREVLLDITQIPPSSLEQAESLEQLRWLENGYRIKTSVTSLDTLAIDTPEDLEKISELYDL